MRPPPQTPPDPGQCRLLLRAPDWPDCFPGPPILLPVLLPAGGAAWGGLLPTHCLAQAPRVTHAGLGWASLMGPLNARTVGH